MAVLGRYACANPQSNLDKVSIHGHIQSMSALPADSVVILYGYHQLLDQPYPHSISVRVSQEGDFNAEISCQDSLGMLAIYVYGKKISLLNEYYFEADDDITLQINQSPNLTTSVFSGKGAEKYNQINFINQQRDKYFEGDVNFESDPEQWFGWMQTFVTKDMARLQGYQEVISSSMLDILEAESAGFYYTQWLTNVSSSWQSSDNVDFKDQVRQLFEDHKIIKGISQQIGSESVYYLLYHLKKSQLDLLFASEGAGYSFEVLFEYLESSYNNALRDRLLVICLDNARAMANVQNFSQEEYFENVQKAKAEIKDPYLLEFLSSKMLLKKGAPVFNFQLPDSSGAIVSLADLKGKVIMLDLWGKGCSGCAQFSRMFENQIYPKLSGNSDFKVVSVGVDSAREVWLGSVESGKYTAKHNLNLHAKKGMKEDLLRYYHLNAVPFILLIDRDGKVYAQLTGTMGAEQIQGLITQALAQK